MSLSIPGEYRIVNYWDYMGEEAPADFEPDKPYYVNADWVMRMMDMLVNGQFASKSFNVIADYASLPNVAEQGQTAYVLGSTDYKDSFFIYNGTSWINPIKQTEEKIETAKLNINYANLQNKPQINGTTLSSGDNTLSTLGIQGKNLYFTNIDAINWVLDTDETYSDYAYKCVLSGLTGVTSGMFALVVFAPTEFDSGNYANVCETGSGTITIWSKLNTAITIPTIVVMGA